MSYIEIKEEPVMFKKLVCNHPKVKKIWEYGGCAASPTNSEMIRVLCIQLEDESVHDFKDNGDGKAIEDAENFLNQLI